MALVGVPSVHVGSVAIIVDAMSVYVGSVAVLACGKSVHVGCQTVGAGVHDFVAWVLHYDGSSYSNVVQ